MRLCIYEDSASAWLEPIALTRPAFALWCGAVPLFERHRRQFGANEIGFWLRPGLAPLWQLERPDDPVNDADWLGDGPTVWTNGRWLPPPDARIDPSSPHVGMIGQQIAYIALPPGEAPEPAALDAWLGDWRQRLPHRDAGGLMLDYLWDHVEHNGACLKRDAAWFRAAHGAQPTRPNVAVEGPAERFVAAPGATIESFVFADTRGGAVLIDEGAIVQSFSRLEGPCYVGRGSWIAGAKLRAGCTIGSHCRIGGEVEASIVQGYSNKAHDGFLGHSYLGEWVNLAAGTQTSDLRNDYDAVRLTVNGHRRSTGRTKVGSFIGDHTKTGLGALLNTGSTIGAFANVLPSGTLLPQLIPSFCQVQHGHLHELRDLRQALVTAGHVMQRRGKTLTDAHKDFYYDLFEATMAERHKVMRESEMRRLRRSV
jgi:UDP-N-acetylglucosamine diphosphorylase / glucose-1-phosphate thymidylyltransferase / UDP-N-acetylgalactosamine diphosphorylase / glucosamine-1-phosphate N-acetyltransferase / galactosamine-1-phosphate N-acetyltransferase